MMLSIFSFVYKGGHTGLAKEDQFRGTGWQEFVQIKSDSWFNFYSDWLDGVDPNQTLVLHYENIKINLRSNILFLTIFYYFIADFAKNFLNGGGGANIGDAKPRPAPFLIAPLIIIFSML